MAIDSHPNGPARGGARTPLGYVIDNESSVRSFLTLILQGCSVDAAEYSDSIQFRKSPPTRPPEIIFLNIGADAQDTVQTLNVLAKSAFGGSIQLMSNRTGAVLESVKQIGEQLKLRMLPMLKKPFDTAAVHAILLSQQVGSPPAAAAKAVSVNLGEALRNNWVEFWYQPKIALRKKQLAGAEAFARVRHPQHGVLLPGSFMPNASTADQLALSEYGLISALKTGQNLAKLGANLRLAVNISVPALMKLKVQEIVRAHRPQVENWAGLIIDVTEEQIVQELGFADELSKSLAPYNVRLAIDDFGRAFTALMKLKAVPFAEMKLDRSLVIDCGTNKVNAPICKSVIDLAHSFGSLAVGIGLEKASDVMALVSMGCDLGQGYLLGQPMPEERFIALLKQRAAPRPAAAPPPATAAVARRR
jgi:EAL domain-containing protein (putative c-di-GMP-specific phosphodiesterase class I)